MKWVVRRKKPNGAIGAIEVDNPDEAIQLRDNFLAKGIRAWVEDEKGRFVTLAPTAPAADKR